MFSPQPWPEWDELAIQQKINKRLTLNLLIQGVAAHTYVTAHHLVRDEIDALHPGLIKWYDKLSVNLHLSQWLSEFFLFMGRPSKFWKTVDRPDHPFHRHPFLKKYGGELSRAAYQWTVRRARTKQLSALPGVQNASALWLLWKVLKIEAQHKQELTNLCVRAICDAWKFDPARLSARLTPDVEFGNLPVPESRLGRLLKSCAAGYSGVQRQPDGSLHVIAKAWTWPLLAHELAKGIAELICLHGINHWDEDSYQYVVQQTDKIEYEIWMIQAGGELWRKFLELVPKNTMLENPLATSLMHVARLPPEPLEQFMMDLMEFPLTAKATLADLVEADTFDSE